MRLLTTFWSMVVFVWALTACTVPAPPCELEALRYPGAMALPGTSLQLGILAASPQFPFTLPQPLRQTQASLAVIDDVRWGFIEPQIPQGGQHSYEWDEEIAALDTRVRTYQQAGFELVMVLRAWNTWARAFTPQGGLIAAGASTPPAAEFVEDYASWVAAVVERYDGDGVDDFPDLQDVNGDGFPDPIRYYQFESLAVVGTSWQGHTPESTVSDYLALLRSGVTAARAAHNDVRILLAGMPALDMLDGFPSVIELQDVIRNMDPAVCGALTAWQELLAATDLYDVVVVESLADYSGLYTLSNWVYAQTGSTVEVWINGATSAPALVGDPQQLQVNPRYPLEGELLWEQVRDPFHPYHQATVEWYRGEQAKLATKKWVYAAWGGFDVMIIGLEQDRPEYQNSSLGLRDLAFQGLLEAADGFTPPKPRPVVPALATLQAQLSGYSHVRRLSVSDELVQWFEFTLEGYPVYVLWVEDGKARVPGDPEAQRMVQLPVRGDEFVAFTVPTQPDQTGPLIEVLMAHDGKLALQLTDTPVILRGERPALFLPQLLGAAAEP